MAIADIIDTPKGTAFLLENGKTMFNPQSRTPLRDKDIKEVVIANHEKFTIYRGGMIVREQGDFKEQIKYSDKYTDATPRPQPGPMVTRQEIGLFGMTIDEWDVDPVMEEWELKHKAIQQLNEAEHKKQKKQFRLRVRLLRAKWRAQQRMIKKHQERHSPLLRLWFQSQQRDAVNQ